MMESRALSFAIGRRMNLNLSSGSCARIASDVADALEHSSYEQRKAKNLDVAIKELKEALALREKALGETHVDVARTLQRLGAITHLTRQENILRQLVGTKHNDYLSCQRELKSAQSKIKEAKPSKMNETGTRDYILIAMQMSHRDWWLVFFDVFVMSMVPSVRHGEYIPQRGGANQNKQTRGNQHQTSTTHLELPVGDGTKTGRVASDHQESRKFTDMN